MLRLRTLGLFLLFVSVNSNGTGKSLRKLFEWKDLEYGFPSRAEREQAIRRGLYVHGNGVPIDVDVHYGDNNVARVFVTVPRFISGIPYSVATVTNSKGDGGPMLAAYPGYQWHSSHGQDCSGITSVFRVMIDECNRIWILDTGRIGTIQYCNPQLLVFDLRTDTLIHRYQFPQSQFKTGVSLFITPLVDVRDPPPVGTCRNTMVYIADVTGFGILAYDFDANTSWRMENKLLFPDPDYGTIKIAGESFDLMDGVFGLALTPRTVRSSGGRNEAAKAGGGYYRPTTRAPSRPVADQERFLYFHSLASVVENRIPLRLVDNRTIWANQPDALPREFKTIGERGTQSGAQAMDSRGNLYFGLMEDIAIAAWNTKTPYNRENFRLVAKDRNTLQFMSGMKIKKNKANKEELWAISCRFQKIFAGTKNPNEVNFRVMGCNTDELLNDGCRINGNDRDNLIFN